MPPIIFKPVDPTIRQLLDKFSKKENWKKEHRYIAGSRLIFGFILGLITAFSIYFLYL